MFMPLGASVLSLKMTLLSFSSFFSLSGCSTTVHLLDHRHFQILDVVVVGQIEVFGHGETSSMIAGIMVISLHRKSNLSSGTIYLPQMLDILFLTPALDIVLLKAPAEICSCIGTRNVIFIPTGRHIDMQISILQKLWRSLLHQDSYSFSE